MVTTEELLAIKSRYQEELLKLSGVTGIGLNGSVIIYVERLTHELSQLLPKQLDGVTVKIVTTGKIVPLSLLQPATPIAHAIYANRTGRFRPAPGGVSVGHPRVTAGTLGCRARDKITGEILGLSNNHVVALAQWGTMDVGRKGDSILQPGPLDGGRYPDDVVGLLDRWQPVELEPAENLIDAAAFTSDMLAKEVLDIGVPDTLVDPQVGGNVLKSGRTSGVTFGKTLDVNATVKVSGGEGWGDCLFTDQIVVSPSIMQGGDSGSWTGEVDTFRTVGLGFAGSETGEVSIHCKAKHVEDTLGVEIIPPLPYVSKRLLGFGLLSGGILVSGMIVSRSPKEKT